MKDSPIVPDAWNHMTAAPYVGRLAPSPTGAQHVGNARTYLIAWLAARHAGGRLVLRIEDIDSPRVKPEAAQQAQDDLHWLGLDWDGSALVQTERLAVYCAALDSLKSADLVYPCTCTRSDIEAAAAAPHLEHEGPAYPGTCAGRHPDESLSLTSSFAWRFRVRHSPEFLDAIRGPIQVNLSEVGGDFVVWKSSSTPAYQLAVVVDDAAQAVTEVIRGDDLIPSTPRQLLLYQALQLAPPRFVHVPLVIGPDGRRLAKRHGDTRLASLRAAGVSPERLVGLLAWSCGWIPQPEPISPPDLLPRFSLAAIPKEPFILTPTLLRSIGYAA